MLSVIRQGKKNVNGKSFMFYKRGIDSKVFDSNLQTRLNQGVLKFLPTKQIALIHNNCFICPFK